MSMPPPAASRQPTPLQILAAHQTFAAQLQQAGIAPPPRVPVEHTPARIAGAHAQLAAAAAVHGKPYNVPGVTPPPGSTAQIERAESQLAATKAALQGTQRKDLQDTQRKDSQDARRKDFNNLLMSLGLPQGLCVPEGLVLACKAVSDRNDKQNKISDVIAKAFAPGTVECPLDALTFVSEQLKCEITCPACKATFPAHNPSHDCPCKPVRCLKAVDSSCTEDERQCPFKCPPGEMLAHLQNDHPGLPHAILHLSKGPSEEFASATYQVPESLVLKNSEAGAEILSKYRWWTSIVHVHGQDHSFWYIDAMVLINGVINCIPMVCGTSPENVTVTHSIRDNKGEEIVKQSMRAVYFDEYNVWDKKMYELVLPKDCSLHVDVKQMHAYNKHAFREVSDGKFYAMNIQAHVVFGKDKKLPLEHSI